jgi:methionyl-tRNA synthetase
MSKSLGNVVDPLEYVEKYGAEALRYFLIRELHPYEDSDFSENKFIESYNANLANGLGNVVSRVLKMAETNEIKIAEKILENYKNEIWNTNQLASYHTFFAEYNLQKAADEVWKEIKQIDEKITETEPFKMIKTDPEKAKQIIADLVMQVWKVSVMVEPFMPETAQKIQTAVLKGQKPDSLFARI